MIKKSDLTNVIATQKARIETIDVGQIRQLLNELSTHPPKFALIISGIRRCGKSTLLYQYVSEYIKGDFIYLNFDSARLYTFEISDFQLLDELIEETECKWLIFDEIQVIQGWEIYVRQKLDEQFNVLISGSNASLLSRELGTKLTGRHITKELFPFSFLEFCSHKDLEVDEVSFLSYLELGGFPEFLNEENNEILSTLLDDIIYRDIAVRHNIRDIKSLKLLLLFLATNCSKLVSANKLKQYIGVKSTATALEYLSFFEESYLVQLVSKFSYSQKVQLVNPRKIYFIDNGLQQAITNSFSKDIGRKLENAVFWELRRKGKELYYFSENGNECDFVVCSNDQVQQLIQVCYHMNSDNEQRELSGLLEAMNFFKFKSGTIITLNQDDVISVQNKRIEIVSAYRFFGNAGVK